MDQQRSKRSIITLSLLAVLGIAYGSLLYYQRTLTGLNHVDGIIGVVFGLYICSHPAANLVDMLFYRRGISYPFSSNRHVALWLGLNMLVLFVGGVVIFIGTTQFIGQPD